jgi:putative ABC transport system substrate-binding protein
MVGVEDPVADRFVRSLAQPETNMTGVTAGSPDTILESVHLLDTLLKPGSAVAMILNQNNAAYRKLRARFRHAAMQDGMRPVMLDANSPGEIAAAFEAAAAEHAAGVALMNDAMFFNERARIVKLAAAARLPAIHPDPAFVDAGGLMSFGPDLHASFARAASFVHRILEGAAPAGMAVEAPGEPRLRINAAAARAMRLSIPKALRDRATRAG